MKYAKRTPIGVPKTERTKWSIFCDQIFFMNNEIIQSGLLLIQTISQTEVSLIQQPGQNLFEETISHHSSFKSLLLYNSLQNPNLISVATSRQRNI